MVKVALMIAGIVGLFNVSNGPKSPFNIFNKKTPADTIKVRVQAAKVKMNSIANVHVNAYQSKIDSVVLASLRSYIHQTTPLVAPMDSFAQSLQSYDIWGLDISHYIHVYDWNKVEDYKPWFVFIKATEGEDRKDNKYPDNWVNLKEKSIIRGAYHFYRFKKDPRKQAQNFIESVKLEPGDLPPVLDLEPNRRMPATHIVQKNVRIFIKIIEDHYGVKPIIYTGYRFYKRYLQGVIEDYPLWMVDLKREPKMENWMFWQHTFTHTAPGMKGYVDRNVFSGTRDDLMELLVKDKTLVDLQEN